MRPRQLFAHLSQHQLVALWEVAAAGATDVLDEVAQLADVGAEVEPLGDVRACVTVVAVPY